MTPDLHALAEELGQCELIVHYYGDSASFAGKCSISTVLLNRAIDAIHALAKLQAAHEAERVAALAKLQQQHEAESSAMRKEMWALSEVAANRSAIPKVKEAFGPLSLWTASGLELIKKEACTAAVAEALEEAAQLAETSRFGDDIPPVIDRQEAWRASACLGQLIADAIRSLKPRSDMVCVPREPTKGTIDEADVLRYEKAMLAAAKEGKG